MKLKAPFPYPGGKGHFARAIWERFGDPVTLIDPFCGSLAVPLARQKPCPREIFSDLNGFVCNFFRALQADPAAVAAAADWPTNHHDLIARHHFLGDFEPSLVDALQTDPAHFDVRIAGLWAWGQCLWIGGGWAVPGVASKRPHLYTHSGGSVLTRQSSRGRTTVAPRVCSEVGGNGLSRQTLAGLPPPLDGSRIRPFLDLLSRRLADAIFLCSSYERFLTPTVLGDIPSSPNDSVAILLDPPYLTSNRNSRIYQSDFESPEPDQAARDTYKWAVEHGDRYRICYCCRHGDFPLPAGWDSITASFSGCWKHHGKNLDEAMFSPGCITPSLQLSLVP